MASTQKKTTAGGKKGSAAGKRSASASSGKKTKKRPIRREVGGVICLLLALCTVVSYFQSEGWLIAFLPTLLKGLTGYGYYLWAFALCVAAYILLRHRGRPVLLRTVCTLLMPVMAGALGHLITCEIDFTSSVGIIPSMWKSGITLTSGGVISGILAHGLRAVFGNVATIVIFVVALLGLALAVFHRALGALWEQWQARERIPYEMEEDAEETRSSAKAAAAKAPAAKAAAGRERRPSIDIPLDDGPVEKRPGVLRGFFRQKSKDQRTPDEVLTEGDRREERHVQPHGEPAMQQETPVQEGMRGAPAAPQFQEEPVETLPREEPSVSAAPHREEPLREEPRRERSAEVSAAVEELPSRRRTAESRAEVASAAAEVTAEIESQSVQDGEAYQYPPITLLDQGDGGNHMEAGAELRSNAQRLAETLDSFGVDASAGDVIRGPSVTRYEFVLEQGVKLSKITNLADDIALALGASGVRIAPVPDKISVVGIEVPNKKVTPVLIRDVLESRAFLQHKSPVAFAVGRDIGNNDIVGDIAKLPHMLIAGTTGSGKSVCTNALIISLLYKSTPEEVRFIMVDPKMVELGIYNGIPHLLIPVVTDPKKAAGALQWAVFEMMRRYKTFSELGVKKLEEYNALAQRTEGMKKMASVVVVIDELADLMLVAAKEVEESICRVAQMGRAAGIHLVIATQRPSADVITGLMKANIPSRIAFAVASSLESRIILDTPGAEKLVGRGDMLYAPLGSGKPQRVQGCLISGEEIERVVRFVKQSGEAEYSDEVMQKIEEAMAEKEKGSKKDRYDGSTTAEVEAMEGDELFPAAVEVVLETGQASVSMLQRRLKLGYSRAARLVDQMEERGIVGPFEGSKPRQLLITKAQWQELQMKKSGGGEEAAEPADAEDAPWNEEQLS